MLFIYSVVFWVGFELLITVLMVAVLFVLPCFRLFLCIGPFVLRVVVFNFPALGVYVFGLGLFLQPM